MPQWTVYSRADCSLCEHLLEELAELLGPEAAAAVQVVDIAGDPELVLGTLTGGLELAEAKRRGLRYKGDPKALRRVRGFTPAAA